MSDDERAGAQGPPPVPDGQIPAPPDGWVAPAPPPPRGGWAPPGRGDPQPFAASYVPRPGYAYAPPPPGSVQPTYQPGLGAFSVLPPAAGGWNWGAFLFTWIWGLCNGAYVTLWGLLLMFVPGGNIAWAIVCGANGNRWAWRGKPWTGVEQFRATQHKWALAALIVFLVAVIVPIVVVVLVVGATRGSATSGVGA
jgi:hypothetical protein